MNVTPKFCENYESLLDNHFESILKNEHLSIPGFVVLAKRGDEVYHKAFGVSDLKSGKAMQTDSMFRRYSMTKVLTSFLALRLYEEELFNFDDPVSKFIPSFDRSWDVVVDSANGKESIAYKSILTGKNLNLNFDRKKSNSPMLIKHLMSESAGIEYDLFSEYDLLAKGGHEI